ncbi:MAG: Hpt domain-containing protein [Deltaproteobacteria bacterium]|nr:Hpt domain-containing protein [Deltaproteobacteria bacterium]MBW1718706.1 Hpt domain-containing protein [Deltaproteobacteria bacterium]MBW2080429.1 Hpt domain-containing protein [Deltaproteobacteria bacterium]MBW2349986.1 Hpt domain-containing protein [Deltaproteobacteria bacterium]
MNIKELAENIGLEKEEYLELVELFVETGKSDMDKLQSAIDEKNVEKVATASHSLKGASGNLGFEEIFEVAKKINDEALEGSLKGTPESAQVLKEKLNAIASLLLPDTNIYIK